jgi:hypothetical protein
MAHDSKRETRRRLPRLAATMFGPDRRRRIDAVIDYFGESREAHAPRPRPSLAAIREYLAGEIWRS